MAQHRRLNQQRGPQHSVDDENRLPMHLGNGGSGRTIGSMPSDRMLARPSSTTCECDTQRTLRSSSTPIRTIPPPEFSKATIDPTTLSGELRSRLNSNDFSSGCATNPERLLLSELLDTYSYARDPVTGLGRPVLALSLFPFGKVKATCDPCSYEMPNMSVEDWTKGLVLANFAKHV